MGDFLKIFSYGFQKNLWRVFKENHRRFSRGILEKFMDDPLTKIAKQILEEILNRCMEDFLKNFQKKSMEDFLKGIPE